MKKSDINNRKSMGLQKPGVIIPAPAALIDMPEGYESFQQSEGWGAKIIDMRKFAQAWPDREIVQRTVAQIPWRSNLTLLEKMRFVL